MKAFRKHAVVVLSLIILSLSFAKCKSTLKGEIGGNVSEKFSKLNGRRLRPPLSYSPGIYDTCGRMTKRCFPSKDNLCFENRNCTYLVTWRLVPKSEYIEFQLITEHLIDKSDRQFCSTKEPNLARYLAIGFSFSKKYERLAVIECSVIPINDTGFKEKRVKFAWSSKTEYIRWDYNCEDLTNKGKLTYCEVKLDKESMLCQFRMKRRVIFKHQIYNLEDSQYFFHLTSGCDISEIARSFMHGGRYIVSEQFVHFNLEDEHFSSFHSHNALWHSCLMTIAWYILVPNGVFFSRYFKESFVEISVFKYRMWFACHSIIMILAFLLTLGGIGTILTERAEVDFAWPAEKTTLLHFNLGFAATLGLIGQISFGWIRCHGKNIRRSFAAIHLFIGSTSYIISMVCIGISYSVGMPCNIMHYTLASGSWTLICHVAMTIHFYHLDKQLGLNISRALYPFPIPPVTYEELPGTKIRLGIFLTHFIGSLLVCIATLSDYLSSDVLCK